MWWFTRHLLNVYSMLVTLLDSGDTGQISWARSLVRGPHPRCSCMIVLPSDLYVLFPLLLNTCLLVCGRPTTLTLQVPPPLSLLPSQSLFWPFPHLELLPVISTIPCASLFVVLIAGYYNDVFMARELLQGRDHATHSFNLWWARVYPRC